MSSAAKELTAQARNFQKMISCVGYPMFSIHVHVAYTLREAVHAQLGQNQATPEPNSDILGSPHGQGYAHAPDIRF